MRWLHTEYILKGIYLGLLFFVALCEPDWQATGLVAAGTFGGLALFLGIAAYRKLREGYLVKGRLAPFILFLLLESPVLVYAGILLGTALGAYFAMPRGEEQDYNLLASCVGGGAVLGVVFGLLRTIRRRDVRLGLSLVLAVGLVGGILYAFGHFGPSEQSVSWLPIKNPIILGVQLLLGIPVFYLLTFAGREEETEVEIAVMCAALGLGVSMLTQAYPNYRSVGLIVPFMLYLFYTTRVLPGLRVFKHAARGFSFAKIGRYRQALQSFRRALQLDPQNKLAREGLWSVHRSMDLPQLVKDPETLALVDLDLCLERASSLLLQPSPGAPKLEEANRLLDLIENQKPAMRPRVAYWRAVACTHAHRFDGATAELEQLLDPAQHTAADAERQAVLLPAWQLALTLHEELRRRVGQPQLALPGRRMEAIAAVERHLAPNPDDAAIWNMKRQLYQDLTEADYEAAAATGAVAEFDYSYCQQLGLALINDPARWQRGAEYLRLAACGLPALGPALYIHIAQAHQRAGSAEAAWHNYELAKRAGQAVGHKNLAEEDRQAFFATVKMLGEGAMARGDLDAAIENYHLYTEYERSGLETLRTLAELHERRGDPLTALRVTEQALVYDGKDKDLLDRKDKYYYSVMPADLRARLETAKHGFDVGYCLRKARALLDARGADLDLIDWAQHLAELAHIVQPDSIAARVLLARARLRRGEKDEAVAMLQEVHGNKPEKFASAEDDEAYSLTCRLLGDLYLNELGRPDLAVSCYNEFRKTYKSGADTLYKLGQAYEQLGDRTRAVKCYQHVTAYEGHPLAPEARDALYRLQAN